MANGRTRGPNAAVYWPDMVEQLKRLAAAENCTPAQLALAWVLSRAPYIVPIPGTSHRDRLEKNVAAASMAPST